MSLLTLRFADPALEQDFQNDHLERTRGPVRVAMVLSCVIYASFGLLDRSTVPDAVGVAAIIRYLIVCPAMLVGVWCVPRMRSLPALQRLVVVLASATGWGVVAMIAVSDAPTRDGYFVGIMLIVIATYTFILLRVAYATLTAWTLVALYLAAMMLSGGMSTAVLASNWFFLVTSNVIGMSAGYTIERQTRVAFLATRKIGEQASLLSAALRGAENLAQRDPLTGAYNRRAFFVIAERELAGADLDGAPLSIAMVDLDHFKFTNDRFGHAVGDRVLRDVVEALRDVVRRDDLIFRFGGEEFVVILPGAAECAAVEIGERLRETIATIALEDDGLPITVSASVGIATRPQPCEGLDVLVGRADAAMYRAKKLGRNQVALA